MQGNEHLDLRRQFYVRMADKILKNQDAAFLFMSIVCETVSVSDLSLIEIAFKKKKKKPAGINNN